MAFLKKTIIADDMIALVNNFHPFSGIGKFSFSLFSELKKQAEAEMLYLESKDNILEHNIQGVKKIRQKFSFPLFNKTLSWYYYFPPRTPEGYSVYHASSQYLSRISCFRKPVVVSHFDLAPIIFPQEHPFVLKYFLKKNLSFYPKAEKILVHSLERKKELLEFGINGLEEEKVQFVPLGVNQKTFFPEKKDKARKYLNLPLGKKIVLNMGAEEERKGTHVLLDAVREIQKALPDSLLVRIGNKNPKFDAQKKGLNILHFSNVKEEKLRLFYSAADTFLFPTLYEGFGYPPVEAMNCACPVITTEEMSSLKEGSIVVDKNNSGILAEKALELLKNDSLHKKYSKKAFDAGKNFSLEQEAKDFLEIFEEVK